MISATLRAYLEQKLGPGFRFYRLGFNIFAIVTLIPVGVYAYQLNGPLVFRWEGYLRSIQILLLVIAGLLFFAGARHYDALQVLGIRQIREKSNHRVLTESGELDTTGILGMVRHPWYTAALALIWARGLDMAAIITNSILTIYLVTGTILEERKLIMEFGNRYRKYQENVSMFFPYKWLKSKLGE
jgi:protein-S-isoprenylcysteine O-methyltransferase Ste14